MDIFSIPVSTVSSEQAFNTTRRILEERRNALQRDIVEALVCIKNWDRADQRLQEGSNAPVSRYLPASPVDVKITYAPKRQEISKTTYEHDVNTFFLDTNLHAGQKLKLHFPNTQNDAKFLTRKAAESMPLSTNKLPEILKHLGIKPDSIQANRVKTAIEQCEAPAIRGEDKFCATSLESLIDFGVSKLGRGVQVYSTEGIKGDNGTKQVYSISKGVKKIGERSVVCHKQNYVYAVFYCHEIHATTAYKVSLVGSDGTNVEAVALCHADTSSWSPQHVAFQMLKVKPGSVPICHFVSRDNLVWVP
ncbi:BURP domain-containing protein 3 [Morus notabilis]|uniref:BURP domain-containing protein 3 n=2 Tax=Morus notabilis TaxID=981085 RepID=W9S2Y1_9ROSA|nr:BURP domain-containing protein 3 [Morus notabilis]